MIARTCTLLLALAVLLVAGCAQLGLEKAQTFSEQIAYVEAGAQGGIKALAELTCKQYTPAGTCTEAGRPLHPARSVGYLDTLSKVRQATRAAATMPATGGMCLGQPSTPTSCLALASAMLAEVNKILLDLQNQKGGV